MDPYAKPKERKVGDKRPKISHLPRAVDTRTRTERKADKQAVAAERRAIKKSARQHLKRQMLDELGLTSSASGGGSTAPRAMLSNCGFAA